MGGERLRRHAPILSTDPEYIRMDGGIRQNGREDISEWMGEYIRMDGGIHQDGWR